MHVGIADQPFTLKSVTGKTISPCYCHLNPPVQKQNDFVCPLCANSPFHSANGTPITQAYGYPIILLQLCGPLIPGLPSSAGQSPRPIFGPESTDVVQNGCDYIYVYTVAYALMIFQFMWEPDIHLNCRYDANSWMCLRKSIHRIGTGQTKGTYVHK